MNARHKGEWLRDIDARQRNIVFPETAENDGRFWRSIVSGTKSLAFAQGIGVSIFWLCVIGLLTGLWPKGDESWWQKLVDGYSIFIVLTAGLVTLIVVGNRRARQKTRRRTLRLPGGGF